jgi:cyclopropane fatty-acyl-phospholipid synthase-like methyltransferase
MSEESQEKWINYRHLILKEPGSDYAIALSNNRKNFEKFINTYVGKLVLDLACGQGVAVDEMNVMGVNALGIDINPGTSRHVINSSIESASSNPQLIGKKFPLIISVQGFGVYVSDRNNPTDQVRNQFQSIAKLMDKNGLLIFTTTSGSDNNYTDYYGKPAPKETLFEMRYIDNPTPQLWDPDKSRIPLLELAEEAGFEHIWNNQEMPLIDQKQVIRLRYIGTRDSSRSS